MGRLGYDEGFSFNDDSTVGYVRSSPGLATPLASDNFNRADGGLGANWTLVSDSLVGIVSNKVDSRGFAGPAQSFASWNANAFNNNQFSQLRLAEDPSGLFSGPMVRMSGTTGYVFMAANGTAVQLYDIIDTTNSTLLSPPVFITLNIGDIIRCEVAGSGLNNIALHGYVNGLLVLTYVVKGTDPVHNSGGVGIFLAGAQGCDINNWQGGNT